ncbi:MAG: hypothetical protein ACMXYL_02215 [Candidatus Woesearchaeota archaeon]
MSLSTLFIGIMLIITAIIFIRRPNAYLSTDPKNDTQQIKRHLKSFTPKKTLIMRILWSGILLVGIVITYLSILRL